MISWHNCNPGRRCEIPPSAINENYEIRGKTI
nr:MAG TPA: hypothetical protein [Caudoviricetes sp.]